MENINEFVNYQGIFEDVVKTHLELYPEFNDYIEDYLNFDSNQLDEDFGKNVSELYQILNNLDRFKKDNEGICFENSSLSTDENDCTVVYFIDNSTSTESGYEADFYLWIFEIDLSEGVIKKYSNDY